MSNEVVKRGRLYLLTTGLNQKWKVIFCKLLSDRLVKQSFDYHYERKKTLCYLYQIVTVDSNSYEGNRFSITLNNQTTINLLAESEIEKDYWVNSILANRNYALAKSGKSIFRIAHDYQEKGFIRFEDSDSDSDSDSCVEVQKKQLQKLQASDEFKNTGSLGTNFKIVHVFVETKSKERLSIALPLMSEYYTSSVEEFKEKAFRKLQKQLNLRDIHDRDKDDILRDIATKDASYFVMKILGGVKDFWCRSESQLLSRCYEYSRTQASSIRDSSIYIQLVQGSNVPPPEIQVTVKSTTNKISDLTGKSFTRYNISVSMMGMSWVISRRFSEFFALQNRLNFHWLKQGIVSPKRKYPQLPRRQLYTPTQGEFIEKRKSKLEDYLRNLVALPEMSDNVHLMSFLGVLSTSRSTQESSDYESRGVIHISNLHNCVKFGDVILFKCKFNASRVQRKFTGSNYDHVGLVVPGPTDSILGVLEATGEGVSVYSLKSRLMAYAKEVSSSIVLRSLLVTRSKGMKDKLVSFVKEVEGNPYSIFGILHTKDNITNQEELSSLKSKKFFCSELVAAGLREMGCIHTSHASSYFWPGSFAEGGEIEACLKSCTMGPELTIDCRVLEISQASKLGM